jgi:mRNA guanylyltransferase
MAVDQFGIGMTYLIDRKNEYHSVQNACFGLKKGRDYVGDTLIDGEIVVSADEITDGIKYLVFDCLIVNGEDCRKLPLERRLKKFRQEFLEVNRIDSGQQGLAAGQVLIDVVVKEMMPAVCLPSLLDSIPRLDHNCDGIIFTPAYLPYRHGTHRHLLDSIPRLDHTCDGIIFTPAYLPYRHGTHRHLVTQMWDHIRSRIMTPAAPNVLSENYLKNK